MDVLLDLWLPIVLASVAVFFASFVLNTILPHHKSDWNQLPNEKAFLQTVRDANLKPGRYMFPWCADFKELKDPEKRKIYEAGPHGILNLWPGMPNMGRNLVLTFLFFVVVSIFIAYITGEARAYGAGFGPVFQIAATTGVMSYCFAFIPNDIWFAKPPRAIAMDVIDGIIYALITGAIFAALWPDAAAGVNELLGG